MEPNAFVDEMRERMESAENNGPCVYSGEGQWREIDDAIRAAGAVSPTPTFLWSVPAGVLRAAGRLNGRLGEIVDRLIGSACYSPARIERELGWRAQVGLAEGVRDMLR